MSRKAAKPSCIYSPSVCPFSQPSVQPPVIHAFQPSAQPPSSVPYYATVVRSTSHPSSHPSSSFVYPTVHPGLPKLIHPTYRTKLLATEPALILTKNMTLPYLSISPSISLITSHPLTYRRPLQGFLKTTFTLPEHPPDPSFPRPKPVRRSAHLPSRISQTHASTWHQAFLNLIDTCLQLYRRNGGQEF